MIAGIIVGLEGFRWTKTASFLAILGDVHCFPYLSGPMRPLLPSTAAAGLMYGIRSGLDTIGEEIRQSVDQRCGQNSLRSHTFESFVYTALPIIVFWLLFRLPIILKRLMNKLNRKAIYNKFLSGTLTGLFQKLGLLDAKKHVEKE